MPDAPGKVMGGGHFWKIDFSQGLAMASPDAANGAEWTFHLDPMAVEHLVELLFRNRISAARLYGSNIELDVGCLIGAIQLTQPPKVRQAFEDASMGWPEVEQARSLVDSYCP